MVTQYTNIFIVGIKGVAMANIARILVQLGKNVSGSDVVEEFITDHELQGIQIFSSFEAQVLPPETDLVIYSAAHGGENNKQVQEAIKRNITVIHQAEFIGKLLTFYHISVAVSGCHGKTTTSSLIAYALKKLGVKPGFLVGVSEFNGIPGGDLGKNDYFVFEADEYAMNPPLDKTPKFHHFQPSHALVTNIDFDHPDVFSGIEETKKAFEKFLKQVKTPTEPLHPHIVLCVEDVHVKKVASSLIRDTYITYGFSSEADVIVSQVTKEGEGMKFKVESSLLKINDEFTISLFGEKNVLNAVGAICILRLFDFSLSQIQIAIESFTGAKRRFEFIYCKNGTYLFDDYAHHPQEIEATIQAARIRFPERRVVVIFQPHTFTRTQSMQHEFIQALSKADVSIIAPIFGSARESVAAQTVTSVDLELLSHKKNIENIKGYNSKEDLMFSLPEHIQKKDIIFTMGAGDIYKLAEEIKKLIH